MRIMERNVGKVEKMLYDKCGKEKMLFALIDPLDHESPEKAVEVAVAAAEGGASAVLIGGSTGVQGELLDGVAKAIKAKTDVPIILFPGNIATLTKHADAVYFMSLLNSRNPYWISQAQMLASPVVKQMGIEPLSVGYVVVEPGGSVGWVGDANLIPRDKPKIGAALGLAGEYMGSKVLLFDVGSASKVGSVPVEMVAAVRKLTTVPLIIAGGMKTPEDAIAIAKAGADVVQVGTMLEKAGSADKVKEICQKIVKEINSA